MTKKERKEGRLIQKIRKEEGNKEKRRKRYILVNRFITR
jgi:hypothetical protein